MTLALVSALLVVAAAIAHRTHVLPLGPAFILLAVGLLGSVAALILYAVRIGLMVARHQPVRAGMVIGLVVALLILAIPASVVYTARRQSNGLPAIHDISTDTDDPPLFVDILPLRADAPNTAEYGGSGIAAQQRQAYPDIAPLVLRLPADRAFDRALAAVNNLKWEVVGSNRDQGRIEATDTTFWFGFKDDVVVRLRPVDGGTRVDMRSLSRVGGGDVGTNAKRIRAYLGRLAQ